jgi:putative ABC transport system permease protein
LSPDTDLAALETKINSDGNTPDIMGEGKIDYFLQDLGQVYFDENNTRSFSIARDEIFIWISWTVIFLILFLAGFNFLNLFFISFRRRWKEFGMKKILGASPFVFWATAVIEACLYLGFSLALSFVMLYTFLPIFNSLLHTSLTIHYLSNPEFLLMSAGLIFVIAVLVILKITGYLYRE